jgi:Fur family transcriptional regulator, ferric uptake regulator
VPDVSAESLVSDLKAAGLRVTAPRRAICAVIASAHDEHLTAAQLHQRAEEMSGSRIDPSTVYRTIEALESVGRLHHVHLGHGPAVLHLRDHGEHHHLVCEVCGRTEDIALDELEGLIAHIEQRHRFRAGGIHFALVGRCVGECDPGNSR